MKVIRSRHGDAHKKLHWVWKAMRQRCFNPSNKDFHNYGGRGIRVCESWSNYTVFKAWAIKNGYEEGLTLERKDVNLGYSPMNCCWILNAQQAKNTRKLALLEYNGEIRPLIYWASITGISIKTLKGRIKRGWSAKRTLTLKPVRGRNQYG